MTVRTCITMLVGLYVAVAVWWLSLFISGSRGGLNNNLFGLFWAFFILTCVSLSFRLTWRLKKFQAKKPLKRAIYLLLTGLLSWGGANVLWSYYNLIEQIDVPFPSYSDVLFLISYPLFLAGVCEFGVFLKSYLNIKVLGLSRTINLLKGTMLVLPVAVATLLNLGLTPAEVDLLKLSINLSYIISDSIILILLVLALIEVYRRDGEARVVSSLCLMLTAFAILLTADIRFFILSMSNKYFNGIYVDILFSGFALLLTLSVLKIMTNEFELTLAEERFQNSMYVLKFTYLREIGLNMIEAFSVPNAGRYAVSLLLSLSILILN